MSPESMRLGVCLPVICGAEERTIPPTPQTRSLGYMPAPGIAATALAIVFLLGTVAAPRAEAQTPAVLHSSTGSSVVADGKSPQAGLVIDTAGNLYGTTEHGGAFDCGTVFKLNTSGNETVLHSFTTSDHDGVSPLAGLIRDAAGNLYGTTWNGGSFADGTVFKLDPSGNETVLYSFDNRMWGEYAPADASGNEKLLYSFAYPDGASPEAGLVMDTAGNLYGTTLVGGASGHGTVFKLDTSHHETVLHSFTNSGGDGALPYAGLVIDAHGNLYGTTEYGGTFTGGIVTHAQPGYGTVFKLDRSGHETVLYSFTKSGGDGMYPGAALLMDTAGNLYGTTQEGGASGYGTLFKLDRSGHETLLHSFAGSGGDGACPEAELIIDSAGSLYGTTKYGGTLTNGGITIGMAGPCLGDPGYGVAFKLDTSGHETVLHSFTASGSDGAYPKAGLIRDTAGNLYGTTESGGAFGYGTVFKLDTSGHETVLHSFPAPVGIPAQDGASLGGISRKKKRDTGISQKASNRKGGTGRCLY
jgi:uncharacterized repeat protein (TIGR03803 family)